MKMKIPILFSTEMVKAILNTKPNAWPPESIGPTNRLNGRREEV
jgi:hypothetical protein